MQIFAGFIDDDSHVLTIDVEEKNYFLDPIDDPIYDESDDEEEIIGEQLSSPTFYEEQEDDEEKQEVVKIAIAPTVNSQADRAHDDFVDVSFLFEVVFRSSEFKNTIILLPHHLKMHRIRGRILSDMRRMMQGKPGYSFRKIRISETDKEVVFF